MKRLFVLIVSLVFLMSIGWANDPPTKFEISSDVEMVIGINSYDNAITQINYQITAEIPEVIITYSVISHESYIPHNEMNKYDVEFTSIRYRDVIADSKTYADNPNQDRYNYLISNKENYIWQSSNSSNLYLPGDGGDILTPVATLAA